MKKEIQFMKSIKRVIAYAKPHRLYFYLAVIFDMTAVGLNMFVPVTLGWAIDKLVGVNNVDFAGLTRMLILIGILAVVSAVFEWFAVYFENTLVNRTSESMREMCFKKINHVPLKFVDNKPHGDILNTMINDIDNITSGFLSSFTSVLSGIVTLISCSAFMLYLNWQLSLVVMILSPLSVILSGYITKKAKKLFKRQVDVNGEISAYTEEMLTNLKIIKAYNNEEENIENFDIINKNLRNCSEKASFFASLAGPSSRFIS